MPMPSPNAPWPPIPVGAENTAEYAAWYSGSPDQLAAYYGPRTGAVSPTTHTAQLRGGVVGAVARWWWGSPTPAGEARTKLHVPLAADICATSADLLFSEPVKLHSENTRMQEAMDDLRDFGLDAKLHEGAEVCAALGGSYLRTVWDSEVSPMPWTEVAHPDGAVPEFRNGRLRAVTLWAELSAIENGTVHRLLEYHEPGAISYRLHAGTRTNLGKTVPLQDHPDTAHLAALVNAEGWQETGTTRLTVAYAPNMLPNRLDPRSPQGRSDLQGVTPMLDALDEAYSSWWRDIRHAKTRVHMPAQYLDDLGPGQGAVADADREIYVPLTGVLGSADGKGLAIDVQQFAIRVNEHAETCRQWTDRIIESAGYSTNTLSSDGGGAITAAEVHAKNRRSYMTRGKKIRYWSQAIRDHVLAQLEVANANLGAGIPLEDFAVEFQDGVQEPAVALANTALALRNAEAASVKTRVQLVHPDWDQDQVDAEAAAILAETGQGEPVPVPEDAGL